MKESTTEVKPHRVQVFISQVLYHTRPAYRYDLQCLKNIFFYFFTELKTYYLSVSYFYLQTLRHRHCWSQPWSLCGSVVEHRNAESEGLRFDSSWRHRFFFLYPMLVTWRKTSFSFFTKLKTYHLSYFYLKRSCKNNSKCTLSYKCWKLILILLCRSFRFRVPQCQPVTA